MEFILEKAENYVDHCRKLEKDLNELKSECQVLKRRKNDVNSRIQAGVCPGQVVREEVRGWLEDVQKIDEDIQDIEERARKIPFYKRAILDQEVRETIKEVKRIQKRGTFNEGLAMERAPTHGKIIPTENLVGEISTKEEIWGHLMGNEVGMIGVCGIGGVGKTTIMKNVHNDLCRETRFEKVIWVTVSYPLNIFELQKKIVDAMGGRLSKDEEVMMRAATLMDTMRRVRFVLILDDVWEKFSLKDVGIPIMQNGCKVVITTRSIEVCKYLDCKIVKVQPLSLEESLNLFLEKVGHDVLQVPRLEVILKFIVKECAGLPLAIIVIAGSMKGEYDIEEWRNALNELRQCVESVRVPEDEIFGRLRFSYDRLRSLQIQKCFLYCSLFRDDYEFSRTELIEGWIDEGLIVELGGRQAAYDRGHAILKKLKQNCLLEECVQSDGGKMHDVVRDMAIKCIDPGFGYIVKAGMKLEKVPNESEWVRDLKKVSLMANHISKIPVGLTPKWSTLSTLILSNNPLTEIPKSFFEDMCGLKVLDLSRTYIEALPSSVSQLEYLSALQLRWCHNLKCLPFLGKLGALKKLDLRHTRVEVVPQGMELLESLEYLDLFCFPLKEIPTGILPKLSNLQYLAVNYFGETCTKIDLEEVARLGKLETLECEFSGIRDWNYFVSEYKNFQSLFAYWLIVGTTIHSKALPSSTDFKRCLGICQCEIGEECIMLPDNLEELWMDRCKNMRSGLNKIALLENATELRWCYIQHCEEMESVVDLDSLYCPVLDKLEKLELYDLPRLHVLVRVEGVATPPRVFSNLKVLFLNNCSGMRKLLSLELVQALQNLEEIKVNNCDQMEEIIASSDSDSDAFPDKFTITFPKLRELTLFRIPQLKSICSGKGVMVCDSIEVISIWGSPELKRIPLQLPLLDNGQPSPPPCLREIRISVLSKEWWESVEWDHPNAKSLLRPFLK